VVIHWLTFGSSADAERDLTHSTQVSLRGPLTRGSASTNYDSDGEPGMKLSTHGLLKEPPPALTSAGTVVDI